jgi:hypothetical protein
MRLITKSPIPYSRVDYSVRACGKLWVKCGKKRNVWGNSGESMG